MEWNWGRFLGFWLVYNLPVYCMIFIYKCIDLHSYRKLHMTNKVCKYLILDLLIIEAAHCLAGCANYMLISLWNDLLYLLFVLAPLLLISPMVILYLIERKSINGKSTLIKSSYVVNLILSFAFFVLYAVFLVWDFLTFAEIVILPTPKDHYVLTKADLILYIGTVLFILLFALIKIISQKKLVKRDNQIKN